MEKRGYPRNGMFFVVLVCGACGQLSLAVYGGFAGMTAAVCYWSVGMLFALGAVLVVAAVLPRGAQVKRLLRVELYLVYLVGVAGGFALGSGARFDGDAVLYALVASIAWGVGSNLYILRARLGSDAERP